MLFARDVTEVCNRVGKRHSLKVKTLTPRHDRGWNLVRFRAGEDEDDVCRRFFQGLEKRVEGGAGKPVDFVDDIDLVSPLAGGVSHSLSKVPNVFHARVRGGIDLDHIEGTP